MWVFGEEPEEIENRKLADFPGITDGWGMFTELPGWATDHLIFRAAAIEAADSISHGVFDEPAPVGEAGSGTGPLPGADEEPDDPDSPPSPEHPDSDPMPDVSAEETGYRRVIEGDNEWLYYGYDVITKCEPSRPFPDTFDRLDQLRDAVESSGRQFVAVIVPDKTTMVPAHLPDTYVGQDCARSATRELWELAEQREYLVDLRTDLANEAARLGEPVYFPQDTHWTDEGPLALTRELADRIEPGITQTWERADVGWRSEGADLAHMLGRSEENRTRQYELRPDGQTDRTGEPLETVPEHRSAPDLDSTINDQTVLFGDSFGQAAARYLFGGFSDLTFGDDAGVVDQDPDALQSLRDSSVVVVQAVERSVAGSLMRYLDDDFIEQVQQTLATSPPP